MAELKITEADPKVIRDTAAGIGQEIEGLAAISSSLNEEISAFVSQWWQGTAKDMFDQQFIQFTETFRVLTESYSGLNEALEKAGGLYEAADGQAAQQVAKCEG